MRPVKQRPRFSSLVLAVSLFLTVAAAALALTAEESKGNFDGPAELPRVYMKTALADTPAPGKVHQLKSGSDLERALNAASCGDVIELEAGGSFQGPVRLPAKHCDDAHWILIRTSAPDDSLPPEGTRISPCYAGVSSLPGRPEYKCSGPQHVLAKIFAAGKGRGPIEFTNGANHYRFLGVEITREAPGGAFHNLISPEKDAAADHIIFDRVWVHGTAQDETTRGLFLSGTRYMAVVDSYFSDFHCTAKTGTCVDAQTIAGGAGDLPMGIFKIVNNYLEASGENIMFGGAAATTTPTDIEIRHNHLFKPPIWMPGSPEFVGGTSGQPFIVKNLFEIKNAQRVLFEGNVLDNSWGGVGQTGFAIVLTPRNQMPNVCPLCRVTDITLRYCKVRHMASGMQIVNAPSGSGGIATAGERYSIHDILFEDIDGETYKGFGLFAMVVSEGPQLRDVKLDHITAFPPRVALNIGTNRDKPLASNFVFTNSILSAAQREFTTTGGGEKNCAFGADRIGPEGVLKNCFSSFTFSHNAIISPTKPWPHDNSFPKNENAVGFVNFNHGKGGDYHLCKEKGPTCSKASPYIHAGTDGKDLGADIDAIDAATRGVE